ncbi:D-alanyl-lipoteichoic acid acyltransferase DltB, MBOAT superfamily [Butyrivibrio fibrisolvens]|uniref:D-alanyl-lipoteichoic acid acyltransferase DltB, MBOAT superfamily n=1 Tax=Butyrivibrio fibrisolvens TaxID=831 RepID=A0A1H9VX56_BUTFI|nr:MBOAT family O-acyltransferase [Butyrivibrio fibrisolvens]SES26109.1 D-alanyl-lipoteichoic acid acyltransferase DltB, MBOAT superfamily [Butyrivibrio fibrisolvens]
MLFNSIDFLLFFPVVVFLYFIVPRKARYIVLLIASYYFYMSWNPKYALLIGISTVITWGCSLIMHKVEDDRKRKLCLALNCVANLGILFVFKYANFAIANISKIMSLMGFSTIDRRLDLLLPVGISFYTFQALSYTFDVYKKEIIPEKNLLKYALYVAFFPQLVAGPIERSTRLLPQVQNVEKINVWNFDRIRDGFLLMTWGFFQKLVIADRASILVNNVINNYSNYGFFEISIAVFLFAFQIYCDFGGYSNIARGAAKIMGFELMLNFRQPYLAKSIKEFWRRWHISLTTWFTDYLYIPLGGNRKGELRKYINIFIVFAVSGLWHGANWSFVAWGLLHATYQVVEALLGKLKKNTNKPLTISKKIRNVIVTFVLTDFAWIFFVCEGFKHSLRLIKQMVTVFQTTDIYELGLDRGNWFMLNFGLIVLLIVDIMHEKNISVYQVVAKQEIWFRWILYFGLLWMTIMFGIYGPSYDTSTFIYFQF